ncbi:extracellular solute-binding protein [Paenibacillus sp. P26]|nr:extracellular solute-binding protein [Paenibacillus sp. P26]
MDTNRILKLISREFEGFEASFRVQSEHFEKSCGGWKVEREFEEIHRLYERMIAGREALSGRYDLFLCVTDWSPEAIRDGLLLPLDDYLRHDPPEGWPDAWAPSMRGLQTGPDDKIYGLPYHDGPEMFIYRSDLFSDPKERAAFAERYGYRLAVPETWKQFVDVAQFFTRPDEGLHGALTASYPDGHNHVYDFLIQLWSRGGELVTSRWEPAFHQTPGQEGLQFLVDLIHKYKVVPEAALEMDSVKAAIILPKGHRHDVELGGLRRRGRDAGTLEDCREGPDRLNPQRRRSGRPPQVAEHLLGARHCGGKREPGYGVPLYEGNGVGGHG